MLVAIWCNTQTLCWCAIHSLQIWADENGHVLFNIVPKHHYMWHMARQAKFINPRKTNTMLDETFMGIVKDIVRSCAHGSQCHRIHMSFVEKYMWALHFFKYGDEWEHTY